MNFVLPPGMKGFRRRCPFRLEAMSAHWSVRVQGADVRSPHKRAVMNVLLSEFSDFVLVKVYDRMPVRHPGLPLQWKRPHIQGRNASGDSSGGENISRLGSVVMPGL